MDKKELLNKIFQKQESTLMKLIQRAENTIGWTEKSFLIVKKDFVKMLEDITPLFANLGIPVYPNTEFDVDYIHCDSQSYGANIFSHDSRIKQMLSGEDGIPSYGASLGATLTYAKNISLIPRHWSLYFFFQELYSLIKEKMSLWQKHENITLKIGDDDFEISHASIDDFVEKIKTINNELKVLKASDDKKQKEINQLKQEFAAIVKHLEESPIETISNSNISNFLKRITDQGIKIGTKVTLAALEYYAQ